MVFPGGSLGWKIRGSLDAAFEKAAYDLVCSVLIVLTHRLKSVAGAKHYREPEVRRGQDGARISYNHGRSKEMIAVPVLECWDYIYILDTFLMHFNDVPEFWSVLFLFVMERRYMMKTYSASKLFGDCQKNNKKGV